MAASRFLLILPLALACAPVPLAPKPPRCTNPVPVSSSERVADLFKKNIASGAVCLMSQGRRFPVNLGDSKASAASTLHLSSSSARLLVNHKVMALELGQCSSGERQNTLQGLTARFSELIKKQGSSVRIRVSKTTSIARLIGLLKRLPKTEIFILREPPNRTYHCPKVDKNASQIVVRSTLSTDLISAVMRPHVSFLRTCYEKSMRKWGETAGRMSIRYVISSSGAVKKFSIVKADLGVMLFSSCIEDTVQQINFPPSNQGPATVLYPMVFSIYDPENHETAR